MDADDHDGGGRSAGPTYKADDKVGKDDDDDNDGMIVLVIVVVVMVVGDSGGDR